jgi:hypothetical protein
MLVKQRVNEWQKCNIGLIYQNGAVLKHTTKCCDWLLSNKTGHGPMAIHTYEFHALLGLGNSIQHTSSTWFIIN